VEEIKIRKTKKPSGGQTKGLQKAMFQKTITISLVGSDQKEINDVAHAIHALNHPHIVGTRHKRKVHMTAMNSSKIMKIFDGKIPTDE